MHWNCKIKLLFCNLQIYGIERPKNETEKMFHALFFSSTKKPNLTIVKIGVFQLLKFRVSRETFCYFWLILGVSRADGRRKKAV